MSQLHLERLRLQVWEHLLTLLASYSMFGLLKGRESSVTSMLKELKWPTLQQRRTNTKVVMMYRIVHHLIAIPSQMYLTVGLSDCRTVGQSDCRIIATAPLLTLLASYSMFGLLKGSMSFGGSVFWRMVFEILSQVR
jgi:hypothetical protein